MSWFGNKDEDETPDWDFVGEKSDTSAYVPMSTLMRWYLYDMDVTNREELAQKIELPPISEEGMQVEQADSERRMSFVEEFEPFCRLISEVNGFVIGSIQEENLKMSWDEMFPGADEEEKERIEAAHEDAIEFLDQVSFAACMFMLSVGFQLGLLAPGPAEAIRKHLDE